MNNSNTNTLIVDKLSKSVPVVLSFLIPIFFLPITSEFFEFNKFALLLSGTLILAVLWIIKLLSGQRIEITRSSLDFPLMALTAAFALSTIFSLNKTISIFGSQGRWFPGLFPILAYVFYFYLATPALKEMKNIKMTIIALVFGATLSTAVSILSYFDIYLGSEEYLRFTNFSLMGSTTSSVVVAAVALIAGLSLLAYEKKFPSRAILTLTALLNLFYVGLIGLPIGWIVVGTGAISMLFMIDLKGYSKNRAGSMVLIGAMLAILLINFVPNTKSVLRNKDFPTEINMSFKDSWVVATSTIRDYPLLATGPSTFYLNYSRYKPLTVNSTPVWNVRFDKPHDEVLNTMSTMGIVGLAVFLWFSSKLVNLGLSTRFLKDETGITQVAATALLATLPVFMFTYASVVNTFLLFQLIILVLAGQALLSETNKSAELVSINFASFASVTTIGESGAVKRDYFHYVAAIPMLLLTGYAGFLFYKVYAAEYFIRKSVLSAQANNGAQIYDFQSKAINLQPTRDTYQIAYAQTNLALANALAAKQDLTDTDKTTIQTLVAQSIRSARIATEVLNPLNVVNWQTRALIYRSIVNVADNAAEWAVASYNTAIQLDPSNPALRLDLGGIYYAKEDYLSAANYFRQATALKADYANAHYNFAQALLKLNDPQSAKRELEITKTLISPDSSDYERVNQELAALNVQPAVAGAETQKPTVEEIAGTVNEVEKITQEPLTNPAQAPIVNPQGIIPDGSQQIQPGL